MYLFLQDLRIFFQKYILNKLYVAITRMNLEISLTLQKNRIESILYLKILYRLNINSYICCALRTVGQCPFMPISVISINSQSVQYFADLEGGAVYLFHILIETYFIELVLDKKPSQLMIKYPFSRFTI